MLNRRNFLRNTGLTTAGLAGSAVLAGNFGALDRIPAAAALGLAPGQVHAASALSANDIAVLQFALNLEYLEAEFYSYVVTGRGLLDNGIPVDGIVGTYGETTGGVKVKFDELGGVGPLRKIAEQLMRDEVNHVLLIRSVLGTEYTIAKPAINLAALGEFNNLHKYLTLARDFEITGVSAYGGAITLINSAILQYAAQIALVEALHSGNLQLLCDLNNVHISPLDDMDVVPPPTGVNFFDDSFNQALAVIRNTSQVLAIVYANGTPGTSKGGFFPAGVNGAIKSV